MIRREITQYGFNYGSLSVERSTADDKNEWVVLTISTPKHRDGKSIQIYATKTGKIVISHQGGGLIYETPLKKALNKKAKEVML